MTKEEFYRKTTEICDLFKVCSRGCPLRELDIHGIHNICIEYEERTEDDFDKIDAAYCKLFGEPEPISAAEITISTTDIMNILSAE